MCSRKASEEAQAGSVPATTTDPGELAYNTDQSVLYILSEVKDLDAALGAKRITKKRWEGDSKFYGWNHVPEGLLSDAQLRVGAVSSLMHCWVHIYLVNGLFNAELQFLLIFMKESGVLVSTLDMFVRKFTWPRASKHPRQLFSKKRIDWETDHYKCDAHECLGVYAVVALF